MLLNQRLAKGQLPRIYLAKCIGENIASSHNAVQDNEKRTILETYHHRKCLEPSVLRQIQQFEDQWICVVYESNSVARINWRGSVVRRVHNECLKTFRILGCPDSELCP